MTALWFFKQRDDQKKIEDDEICEISLIFVSNSRFFSSEKSYFLKNKTELLAQYTVMLTFTVYLSARPFDHRNLLRVLTLYSNTTPLYTS